MKVIYNQEEFDQAKSRDLVTITCNHCTTTFRKPKNRVQAALKKIDSHKFRYCSRTCKDLFLNKRINTVCTQCGIQVSKIAKEVGKSKSGNVFCSRSCAGIYNTAHKTTGYRRSSYEIYLEELLIQRGYTVLTNSRLEGYELDLWIKELNIAIEVNGITHYKPIYGEDKLNSIQQRDKLKQEICSQHNIQLEVFDVSTFTHFKKYKHECEIFLDQLLGAHCQSCTD